MDLDVQNVSDIIYEQLKMFTRLPNFEGAMCSTVDPEIFFPSAGSHRRIMQAKDICFKCYRRVECLNFALEEGITWGIWGGTTGRDRRHLKKLLNQVGE